MHFLEMMREGGPLAMVALLLGLLGAILGAIAVIVGLGGSRAGFGLGVATLILATLSSGAGIGGTLLGKKQVDAALAMVDNDIDRELISRVGHKEASSASTLAAFASLLPLLLGALGALAGARAQSGPQRRQGIDVSPTEMQSGESSGRAVLAAVFIGIAALALSGAWVTGHRPPPPGKYDFAAEDRDAWDLARGVDDVQRSLTFKTDPSSEMNPERLYENKLANACERLGHALENYWKSEDRTQWPRVFTGIPPAITGWKEAAGKCVEFELKPRKASGESDTVKLGPDQLLASPLLLDDQLKERVSAMLAAPEPPAPSEDPPPTVGTGMLDRSEIQRVMRGALGKIKNCFERELVKNPTLEGKLIIELVISPKGSVSKADEVDGPFPEKRVSDCVSKELLKLKFPAPEGGGMITVRYPFTFKAAQ